MSCCEQTPTKKEFLESKLKNFRAFLEPHCGTELLKQRLASLQTLEDVMPFAIQATAMSKAGQGDALVSQFCAEFGEVSDEFRSRVGRYLALFVEVLGS